MKIRNLSTDKIIYERNSERHYTFASAQKFIALTALQRYFSYSSYTFSTFIWQNERDYYLDINAPFYSNHLDTLLKMIKKNAFVQNFHIVNSMFSLPPIMDGKMIEDTKFCYGALITEVHINQNCLNITNPNAANNVAKNNLNNVKLILKELIMKNNIKMQGKILYSNNVPNSAFKIAEIRTDFHHIASYAMKLSNNFITDYSLAAFANMYHVNNWSDAGSLLKRLIFEQFSIDLSQSMMVDASGISRYNLFTPSQFDAFLKRIHCDRQFEMFKAMLARPGDIGTLQNRFKGINISAKTGTMTGISSLVGYVYDKHNTLYSLVIVSNNYLGHKHKYAELEEKIIRILLAEST